MVQRILGTSEDMGKLLGLDKDWAARAIKAVGNYPAIKAAGVKAFRFEDGAAVLELDSGKYRFRSELR